MHVTGIDNQNILFSFFLALIQIHGLVLLNVNFLKLLHRGPAFICPQMGNTFSVVFFLIETFKM